MYVKCKTFNIFKMAYGLFSYNCRVAALTTFYPTESGIIKRYLTANRIIPRKFEIERTI